MIPAAYYAIFSTTYIFDLVNSSCTAEFLHDANEPVEREFAIPFERLNRVGSPFALSPFRRRGAERNDCTPEQFIQSVATAKKHIQRGDVFQVVISRAFSQQYEGDELSLFRTLRNLNPSPYSFFLDAGDFKILGTSPELQLNVTDRVATINPIAGTVSSSHADLEQELVQNRKERAEHMMLVDLARNDLSMHCHDVGVSELAAVHHYSHVSHLVSTVVGTPDTPESAIKLLFDSAPAGTLSGAPKKLAIEIRDGERRRVDVDLVHLAIGFDERFQDLPMFIQDRHRELSTLLASSRPAFTARFQRNKGAGPQRNSQQCSTWCSQRHVCPNQDRQFLGASVGWQAQGLLN